MQRTKEEERQQRQHNQAQRGGNVIILVLQIAGANAADPRADEQHGQRRGQPANERHCLRENIGQGDIKAENREADERRNDVRVEQHAFEADVLPPLKQAHADRPRYKDKGDVVSDGVNHPVRVDGENDRIAHEAAVGKPFQIGQHGALVMRPVAEEEERTEQRRQNRDDGQPQRQQKIDQHARFKRALHVINRQHGQGDVDDQLRHAANGFVGEKAQLSAERADKDDEEEDDDLRGDGHG